MRYCDMTKLNLNWSGEAADGVTREAEPWETALAKWADSYSGQEMMAFEAGFAAGKAQACCQRDPLRIAELESELALLKKSTSL